MSARKNKIDTKLEIIQAAHSYDCAATIRFVLSVSQTLTVFARC